MGVSFDKLRMSGVRLPLNRRGGFETRPYTATGEGWDGGVLRQAQDERGAIAP